MRAGKHERNLRLGHSKAGASVFSGDVQKSINHLRKIALNLAKQFKSRLGLKTSISGILRRNLFDPIFLIAFLSCFAED